jgi:tRNA G37 N-methylase Trm5
MKEMNFNGYSITKTKDSKADEDIYTYTAKNIGARVDEELCPGPTYIYPHILVISKEAHPQGTSFTYFKTVADQYAWYRYILKDLKNDEGCIKAKADEIVAGKNDDMEKVKAIFYGCKIIFAISPSKTALQDFYLIKQKKCCAKNTVIVKAWPILQKNY